MKFQLILALALLIGMAGAAEIKPSQINWSQSLPEGADITLDEGWIFNASTDQYINIETKGAVGDGTTDNTAAIQDAIDLGESTHLPVYVPGGDFHYASPLYIDYIGGAIIFGNSQATGTDSGKSVLQYTGSGAGLRINRSADEWVYSVELRDLVMYGEGDNNGIYIDHLSESLFERVTFYNFTTAIEADEMDITKVRDCVISECTNGFWNDEIRAVTFEGMNVWDVVNAFRFNDVYSTNILSSHFEKFNNSVLIQNTEGGSDIKGLTLGYNHFLNGDDMNIDSRVVRLSADDASNTFTIDNMVLESNFISLYDSSHVIEVDVSGTAGFCYGYTVLDSNKIDVIGTAVITTDNTNFRWCAMNNRIYLDKPILAGDYDSQLSGFTQVYQDFRVYGPFRLDNQSGDQKGDIWIDPSTNKLKFYNGAAVETVTSST